METVYDISITISRQSGQVHVMAKDLVYQCIYNPDFRCSGSRSVGISQYCRSTG